MMSIPSIQSIRGDWGMAVEIVPGLWRVRLANPIGSLTINTYAFRRGGETLIIDPGWPWTQNFLREAIAAIGFGTLHDVDVFAYTHTHPDHMGLAAVLSHKYGGDQLVPGRIPDDNLDHWHAFIDWMSDWAEWEISALAKSARQEARERNANAPLEKKNFMVREFGELDVKNRIKLFDHDSFHVGGVTFQWFDTPGHDQYHGVFYVPAEGWAFVGDVILATPTPFFTFLHDDVSAYLSSIDRIEGMAPQMLMPGHGSQRSGDLEKMFEKSRGYVLELDERIIDSLSNEPQGLYEISFAASESDTGVRTPSRWLWYLGRVEAQLHRLAALGKVVRSDDDGPHYHLA